MKKIRIVTNSDRCHCSVDNVPVATFLYSNYQDRDDDSKKAHAINDAKIQCFNELDKCRQEGIKGVIDTVIVSA